LKKKKGAWIHLGRRIFGQLQLLIMSLKYIRVKILLYRGVPDVVGGGVFGVIVRSDKHIFNIGLSYETPRHLR
jgi:hypothetical protein